MIAALLGFGVVATLILMYREHIPTIYTWCISVSIIFFALSTLTFEKG